MVFCFMGKIMPKSTFRPIILNDNFFSLTLIQQILSKSAIVQIHFFEKLLMI